MSRNPWTVATAAVVVVAGWVGGAEASSAERRAVDRLHLLANRLSADLKEREVHLPDGTPVPILESDGGMLSFIRLRQCLKTIDDANAWPATWLVVQDKSRPFDLVLLMKLGPDGYVEPPEIAFAVGRIEWDHARLESAVRVATGRRPPRAGRHNLVIQSFSRRTVDEYVYKLDPEVRGLHALLPPDSLIRDARSVVLEDGTPYTMALVIVEPRFLPSSCDRCQDRRYGHSDTGRVLLVLAGDAGLTDTLDLTEALRGAGRQAMVPRFLCEPGDEDLGFRSQPVTERFRDREPIDLLEIQDHDGDGFPGEVVLDGELLDCERRTKVVAGVEPEAPRLRRIGRTR